MYHTSKFSKKKQNYFAPGGETMRKIQPISVPKTPAEKFFKQKLRIETFKTILNLIKILI